MAKNKQNKPKKDPKVNGELTSMNDKSNESRNSKNGYMEQQPNSHSNQMK